MILYTSEVDTEEKLTTDLLKKITSNIARRYGELNTDFWNHPNNKIDISDKYQLNYIHMEKDGILAIAQFYYNHDYHINMLEETVLDEQKHKIGFTVYAESVSNMNRYMMTCNIPLTLKELQANEIQLSDKGIPVSLLPEPMDGKGLLLLDRLRAGEFKTNLPVIFISKLRKTNQFLADPLLLSSRLNGAAHVLIESHCKEEEDKMFLARNGFINISYRDDFVFINTNKIHDPETMIMKRVLLHNLKNRDSDYTWDSVDKRFTISKMMSLQQENKESRELVESTDNELRSQEQEIQNMKMKIEKLYQENQRLENENEKLRERMKFSDTTLLEYGTEKEKYTDEVKLLILDTLQTAMEQSKPGIRRYDVLKDILEANAYNNDLGEMKDEIRNKLIKSSNIREFIGVLNGLDGIEFDADARSSTHPKIRFANDDRYLACSPGTPSDHRSIKNLTAKVLSIFF